MTPSDPSWCTCYLCEEKRDFGSGYMLAVLAFRLEALNTDLLRQLDAHRWYEFPIANMKLKLIQLATNFLARKMRETYDGTGRHHVTRRGQEAIDLWAAMSAKTPDYEEDRP